MKRNRNFKLSIIMLMLALLFASCVVMTNETHPKIDPPVRIGMSETEVRNAIGEPNSKNVTQGSYGRHEQWVYPCEFRYDRKKKQTIKICDYVGFKYSTYLYFENGKLTSWQH